MKSCCSDLADYQWLTGPEAAEVLRDLAVRTAAASGEPLHTAAGRLRRHFSAGRVHLLLEQAELRRRATAKFASAERMFFTRLGLQQATDEWVARYKAGRFADAVSRGLLADLCCGIGGDLLALAQGGPTVGVDRDPIATCLAAANARAILPAELADRVELSCLEVERFAACGLAAWHIDPDRRTTGNRTTSLDWSSPDQQAIQQLLATAPHAAVKLAPATDVPAAWAERCELEWISRDRQCRQLVAWRGELANSAGQRRATVLSSDGIAVRSVVGQPDRAIPFAQRLEHFLFEPDPAVLAAQLTSALAAEHDLTAISPGIAYFTGPRPIDDPALSCFAVEEVLPLKLRQLAQHLGARGVGRLEIKKRGVDHDPDQVRRQLNLHGDESATLFLTKLNSEHVVILARRVEVDRSSVSPTSDLQPPTSTHAACL